PWDRRAVHCERPGHERRTCHVHGRGLRGTEALFKSKVAEPGDELERSVEEPQHHVAFAAPQSAVREHIDPAEDGTRTAAASSCTRAKRTRPGDNLRVLLAREHVEERTCDQWSAQ